VNCHKAISLWLTVILLLLITLSNYVPVTIEQNSIVKINWKVQSDPTIYDDFVFTVCGIENYIYVFGSQDKHFFFRVEMRFKSNGSLVKVWTFSYSTILSDCIILNDRIYAVEKWNLLVFDLSLSLLNFTHRHLEGGGRSVTFYENYLFIAGLEKVKDYITWRIEKWKVEGLTIVKEYTSDLNQKHGVLYDISVNPVTKQLWAVGSEDYIRFRAEILDLDLKQLKVIYLNDTRSALAIDFDEEGYAYIAGIDFIAKFGKDGSLITLKKIPALFSKLVYATGYVIVAAIEKVNEQGGQVIYVYDKNLNQIERLVLNEGMDSEFQLSKMIFDGKDLYVAGSYGGLSNTGWIIYSISVPRVEHTTTTSHDNISPINNNREIMIMKYLVIATIVLAIVSIVIFIFIRRKLKSLNQYPSKQR